MNMFDSNSSYARATQGHCILGKQICVPFAFCKGVAGLRAREHARIINRQIHLSMFEFHQVHPKKFGKPSMEWRKNSQGEFMLSTQGMATACLHSISF